jgi:hypothetical protein
MQNQRADELEYRFLRSYVDFAARARALAVCVLSERYSRSSSADERHLLHLLAIEQYAAAVETFEAFFRAIRDRRRKPVLITIQEDFNPGNLVAELERKQAADIYQELDIDETAFTDAEREAVRRDFEGIITAIKEISPHNRDFLVPVHNVLKHKFLVYRDADGVFLPLLHPEREKVLEERYGKIAAAEPTPPDDINYLVTMTKWMESATRGLIAVRLLELQKGV